MTDEKQYVRPGVLALRQQVKIYKQLIGELSIGNFQDDRIGVDLALSYYLANGRWGVGARGGLSGSSTFYGGEWVISRLQRVTWDAWVSYYEPNYGLEFKLAAVRKIYGDTGVQGELSRRFGEVMIGFWSSYTTALNGGFNFTVTLPCDRRLKRNRGFRVTYPEYYSFNYKARNGGNEELYGYSYNTRPDAGSLDSYFNPNYIMTELQKRK